MQAATQKETALPGRRRWLKTGLGALAALAVPALARRAGAQMAQKGLIGTAVSPYFEKKENGTIRCTLCPRACRLAEGRRGFCRVRENRGGKGISLVYGNPCIVQADPVERKPFYHVLPGERALSVATAGCNLACKFCEVWDTALVQPEEVFAYDLPPEEIMRQAHGTDIRAIAYTFGEPVVFFEYMMDIARLAREAGLKNLLHTNGYIEPAPLRDLLPLLDAINIDLKAFCPATYNKLCGGELAPVMKTLKKLAAAGIHMEITCLIIPTLTDKQEDIKAMSRWIRDELGAHVPLHLARFYPLYKLANLPPTPVSSLDAARETARANGLEFVYISRVPGHEGENTHCPACDGMVIERKGFMVEKINMRADACAHCGRAISGIWS